MIAPAQESNQQYKQPGIEFQRLLKDLQNSEKLLLLENYSGITLEDLNQYLRENSLVNKHFGLLFHFHIDNDNKRLIPTKMVTYGKEKVVFKIEELLGDWIKWNPRFGGRGTSAQGCFILGDNRDERMPDVAYTPRHTDRVLTNNQVWTYQGDPFAPTFVVEIDTLTGKGSQRKNLDLKMTNDYFPHVMLLY
jgi:Uma2 family endonuclease